MSPAKTASDNNLHTRGHNVVLVIHGGVKTSTRETNPPEVQAAFRAGLSEALMAGYQVLKGGGEALDAAVAAVASMEDNHMFNAGKGATFTTAGSNEMDASVMVSKPPATHPKLKPTRRGFGATQLYHARNPSKVARALYLAPDYTPHTILCGSAAESLGQQLGETLVHPSYFFTENRWKEHRIASGLPFEPYPHGLAPNDEDGDPVTTNVSQGAPFGEFPKGTVGAVALDVRGCIATVTSTGGRTNKMPGRVGDSAFMGAGHWAEEWVQKPSSLLQRLLGMVSKRPKTRGVGISGTGDGDYFIRTAAAATIAHRMRWLGESVSDAATWAIAQLSGPGAIIALDLEGNVAIPMNGPGMYRGIIRSDGIPKTAIFSDESMTP